ncbi:unnamed protein product [Cyprideis torosa]|uniref:Uncharacterized protein n=1 Tax=Cyprideis torosa TaxID=163714 RepID=A0A7R8ZTE9_9CRUS|nr:unnamed protein product [Cyprideis torosa]CAG0898077.1 unnamed protein product [Cyprideis torosa]
MISTQGIVASNLPWFLVFLLNSVKHEIRLLEGNCSVFKWLSLDTSESSGISAFIPRLILVLSVSLICIALALTLNQSHHDHQQILLLEHARISENPGSIPDQNLEQVRSSILYSFYRHFMDEPSLLQQTIENAALVLLPLIFLVVLWLLIHLISFFYVIFTTDVSLFDVCPYSVNQNIKFLDIFFHMTTVATEDYMAKVLLNYLHKSWNEKGVKHAIVEGALTFCSAALYVSSLVLLNLLRWAVETYWFCRIIECELLRITSAPRPDLQNRGDATRRSRAGSRVHQDHFIGAAPAVKASGKAQTRLNLSQRYRKLENLCQDIRQLKHRLSA